MNCFAGGSIQFFVGLIVHHHKQFTCLIEQAVDVAYQTFTPMKIRPFSLSSFVNKEPKFSVLIVLSVLVGMFFLYDFGVSDSSTVQQPTATLDQPVADPDHLPVQRCVQRQEDVQLCKLKRTVIILQETYPPVTY